MNAVALESFVGRTGSLVVEKLVVAGSEMEEHLLLVAVTDDQRSLDPEATRRMLELPADVTTERRGAALGSTAAIDALDTRRSEVFADLADRQATWFDQEIDKFDRWADDQRHALRAELKGSRRRDQGPETIWPNGRRLTREAGTPAKDSRRRIPQGRGHGANTMTAHGTWKLRRMSCSTRSKRGCQLKQRPSGSSPRDGN